MFDKYKKEFLMIKHPREINDFRKKYPGFKDDKEMRIHFANICKKHMKLDTVDDHSDPREAFRNK
ncbi:MAG TPA: hypothetical protein GXZ78_04850 [Eubacteriaceae bacterium]|nr:hypothetical protein [Eubacteriaceae bacterium]